MNEREQLRLAAKAAGIELSFEPDGIPRNVTGMHPQMNVFSAPAWYPRDNDGDALRLAAALRITVGDDDQSVCPMAFAYMRHRDSLPRCYAPSQDDPAAAYRIVIFRAAVAAGLAGQGINTTTPA